MLSDFERPTRPVDARELESSVVQCIRSSRPTNRLDDEAQPEIHLRIPGPPRLPSEVVEARCAVSDSEEFEAAFAWLTLQAPVGAPTGT